jgi:hypothetical protein
VSNVKVIKLDVLKKWDNNFMSPPNKWSKKEDVVYRSEIVVSFGEVMFQASVITPWHTVEANRRTYVDDPTASGDLYDFIVHSLRTSAIAELEAELKARMDEHLQATPAKP